MMLFTENIFLPGRKRFISKIGQNTITQIELVNSYGDVGIEGYKFRVAKGWTIHSVPGRINIGI